MKRRIYSLFIALSLLVVSACDLDELLVDPNVVTPDTADPNLLLNNVQLGFAGHFSGTSFYGERLTRIMSQPNNLYEQAYVPVNFNGIWTGSYSGLLNDIKLIEQLGEERNLQRHLGMARFFKAYILVNLVDWFGDVPFSEALDPSNFHPNYDSGASIYAAALSILDQAAGNFTAATAPGAPQDLYYNGNWARWIKAINTMKLKIHMNLRLIDQAGSTSAINALIATNDFIGAGDDFVFRYGTNFTDPAAQHPRYSQYNNRGGGDYQSTWFMWHLTEAKGFDDPRVRYYLYRQRTQITTDPDELRCISEIAPAHYLAGGWPFCTPNDRGYWGRDHLNAEGIPPDGPLRTMWGVYPIGGRFDNDAGATVAPGQGGGGAGIQPILMHWFVDFMLAEFALEVQGNAALAGERMEQGIRKNMAYVREFGESMDGGAVSGWQSRAAFNADVDDYVGYVNGVYAAAASNDRRLNVIAREYWLALFGNGNEAYNLYRRTNGKPDNMQPGLLESFGTFPRTLLYPNNHMVTNVNAVQKSGLGVTTFWDNNPAGSFPNGIY
ncbi:MAG: SusD/RagB family nutrient-binding outer membrane lipoprotein [Cecembia sp.]|jgi:hypothetical protein